MHCTEDLRARTRGRIAGFAAAAVLAIGGCTVGAPPGFSDGDRWAIPLVGPLEDGILLTPVTIRGHGPYLFAIDPDANVSAVDTIVVQEVGMRMGSGPRRLDESDTTQIRHYAEAIDLKVAGLTLDRRDLMVFPVGFYDTQSRHIKGILGRDVIADSLVFGFDRAHGVATLMTTKAFTPPPGAMTISYEAVSAAAFGGMPPSAERQYDATRPAYATGMPISDAGDISPIPRRLVTARIAGATLTMHLDLGADTSQLRQNAWGQTQLSSQDLELRMTDEAVIARSVKSVAIAPVVEVGPVRGSYVTFAPFIDKRFPTARMDGTLGLDFFRDYSVYAHWDDRKFFVQPRRDAAATLSARLGRWGNAFAGCPHLGCVTVELVTAQNGMGLRVARDPEAVGRPIEVYVGVTPAAGKTAAPVVVELPENVNEVATLLPSNYEGATVAVLDASPFTRPCVDVGGCSMPLGAVAASDANLAPPSGPVPDAPQAGAAPSGPKNVAVEKLTRTAGDPAIAPNASAQTAASGKPFAAAIVRVCLAPDGRVETVKVVKTSGVAVYDQQLQDTIKATWAFSSGTIDAAQVCTSVTFAPSK